MYCMYEKYFSGRHVHHNQGAGETHKRHMKCLEAAKLEKQSFHSEKL